MNRLDLSSEWHISGASDFDFDFDFTFPPVNSLSPTTITRQTFSFNSLSSPRPQSAGQRLSPFSEFVNLEVIDTPPNFQLMTNLPYFRLQSILEQPGVTISRLPACFPRLTVDCRVHLSADTSCAKRNSIITIEDYYHPTDRGTASCLIETTRYKTRAPAYGTYCPGYEQAPTIHA